MREKIAETGKDCELDVEVRRLKAGDVNAMETLYVRYSPHIFQYISKLVSYTYDAEDLMHDVFETAIMNCSQLKDEHKFQAWLWGIAYRLSMKKLTERYQENVITQVEELEEDIILRTESPNPEEVILNRALQEKVLDMVQSLPKPQKEVMIAFFYEGKTLKEIADQAGCSVNTVKTRLRDAKKKLYRGSKRWFVKWGE